MELYKRQRNHVLSLLRASKQAFFDDLGNSDAKGFWKCIKTINTSKKTTIPATLTDGSDTAETSLSKATLLNNFFHRCFNRKCPPLCPTAPIACEHLDPAGFPAEFLCSSDNVGDMLVNLDMSKSSGSDNITPRMLKCTAYT